MYRIISSILIAFTLSISAPVDLQYVTLDIIVTDRVLPEESSEANIEVGTPFTKTLLLDPSKNGVVQYFDQPIHEIGILVKPFTPDCGGQPCPWFVLEDRPFPFPPKYGIRSMHAMYSPNKNDTLRLLRVIDEEHMFVINFDCPPGISGLIKEGTSGVGCELVALKAPYNDSLIYSEDLWPWDPNSSMYTGFLFKFQVTRVASTPPSNNYLKIISVPDINSNGTPELATLFIDKSYGNSVVSLQDVITGEIIKEINFFDNSWLPKDLSLLPDINGDYVNDLSVLAISKKTGMAQVRVKDGETGKLLNTLEVTALGPQPEPPDKEIKILHQRRNLSSK